MKFRWETEFKETEIGEIPREWEVKKLGEILAKIIKGKNPKKCLGDLPYLTAKYLRGEEEAEEFYNETAGVLVDENEIVIIWDGSNSGEVFKSKKGILASTMCKLLFDEEVANKTYVFYVLKTKEEDIKGAKSGTDDRHVDKEYFLNLLIPLPPLPEQSRIATVLSWFDDLIEIKKKQNEILEKTAMDIFKNWFIDFEPFKDEEFIFNEELEREIPKGWEVKKIGDVINFIYGKGLPEMNRKEGIYPVVGSSGIVGFHSEYIAEPPTIIIGRKGNAGSVQLFLENSYPIDTVFYSSKHTQPEIIFYVYHLLKIISLEDLALTDTAVPGLNIHMLNSLILFLPPPHILQSFHSLVEPLFQKIFLNQKQIMTIRKIRDTLLPLLVFGKLRVEEL
jgi:type I restriction enzyme S subunit